MIIISFLYSTNQVSLIQLLAISILIIRICKLSGFGILIPLRGLMGHRHLKIISISTQNRFSHESLITLPLISKKIYLYFSIHNQYPIGIIMIPLTLVKINSKKSKIKTNVKKFCNDISVKYLLSNSPKVHQCPLFDELLHCINQQFHHEVANNW